MPLLLVQVAGGLVGPVSVLQLGGKAGGFVSMGRSVSAGKLNPVSLLLRTEKRAGLALALGAGARRTSAAVGADAAADVVRRSWSGREQLRRPIWQQEQSRWWLQWRRMRRSAMPGWVSGRELLIVIVFCLAAMDLLICSCGRGCNIRPTWLLGYGDSWSPVAKPTSTSRPLLVPSVSIEPRPAPDAYAGADAGSQGSARPTHLLVAPASSPPPSDGCRGGSPTRCWCKASWPLAVRQAMTGRARAVAVRPARGVSVSVAVTVAVGSRGRSPSSRKNGVQERTSGVIGERGGAAALGLAIPGLDIGLAELSAMSIHEADAWWAVAAAPPIPTVGTLAPASRLCADVSTKDPCRMMLNTGSSSVLPWP